MTVAAAKRALDLVLASLGLLLLAPVFAVVAIAVKLDSRGPVFFRQERVGRGGKHFRMIKFRTMVVDAERLGTNISPTRDPRLTRVGAFLRRAFLDEAPQLVNVLKGDMSLVGPRPETPDYAALFSPEERAILAVRPGMSGPSTLAYSRDEAAILAAQQDPNRYYEDHLLHERVRVDLEYLESPTPWQDIRILARTALLVVSELGDRRARSPDAAAVGHRDGQPA
jgi:lipopolysaccharide/colanic/teichoic acid biosynthesis glycosyltransferase